MNCNVIELIPALGDGGAETLVKEYCVLAKRYKLGNAIPTVVWGDVQSANTIQLCENNIEIEAIFKNRNVITIGIKKLFGFIIIPMRLNRLIKKHNATAVHFHLGILKYAPWLAKLNKDVNIYYTCHSIVKHYFPRKGGAEYRAAKTLLKKNRLTMIALHMSMKNDLDSLFGIETTEVIYNGVDYTKFYLDNGVKESIREKNGIPKDAFVIGHVGRLSSNKNHRFILKIFTQVLNVNAKAYLLLIGNGELKKEIEQQVKDYSIEDRVCLLTHRSDVQELMKAMDVFVFPSIYEGLGIALIEAQATGLKCVVSDKVPKEVCITDLVHFFPLEEMEAMWVEEILKPQMHYTKYTNYEEYNMQNVMRKLFGLYLRKRE